MAACIVIRYGLNGPGSEFRWTRNFLCPSRPVPRPHPGSCTMGIREVKGTERGADPPPLCSTEVATGLELQAYLRLNSVRVEARHGITSFVRKVQRLI
jgi:hypothetical protein